jgi:hypothetical protein
MRRSAALLFLLAACSRPGAAPVPVTPPAAAASAEPSTDVYTYRLERLLPFGERLVNVTRRRGYDNQPAWDGSAILYTANVGSQTDIYRYAGGAHSRVTNTPESEYSPSITPDGAAVSVVRVEADSTQRLWRFPDGGAAPTVLLHDVKPVGYYAWLDSTTLALYVLGDPNTLRIADTRTGRARVSTTAIGRSLQRVPGGRKASFVQRSGNRWVLKTVDPRTFRLDSIAVLPDSAEYVAWRSDRVVYTAGGSRIYRMDLPRTRWTLVVDLAERGIRRISRVALSPDGGTLAFVADDAR